MTATPPRASTPQFGLLEWFWINDHAQVEKALADLQRLGVDHLRLGVSWADYEREDGQDWFDWLLGLLAEHFELLPCFTYTPPSLGEWASTSAPPVDLKAYANFIDHCIERHGQHFDTVELWNEPNNSREWSYEADPTWEKFAAMISGAAHWARRRGKRTVLGGMSPIDRNWLHTMYRLGVLAHIDVVGLHAFPNSYDGEAVPLDERVTHVRAQLDHYGLQKTELWLTEIGYPTWRHDQFQQLTTLAEVLDLPVGRVYWLCLYDLPAQRPSLAGFHVDPRDYYFGLKTAGGSEKLLYRVWSRRGLQGVREMAGWPSLAPAAPARETTLITGGAGFVGSNLAAKLAQNGRQVRVFDSLARPGVERNVAWLRQRYGNRVEFIPGDIRDALAVERAVAGCRQIFHLAAQVAVTTSFVSPGEDFDINLVGTMNLLQAVRAQRKPPGLVFTSTNKVYGKLDGLAVEADSTRYRPLDQDLHRYGVSESQPLEFVSPYGCSKGAADQYVLDHARYLDVPAVVFRMSCIYGPRQFGTEDQGWLAHFLLRARAGDPVTIFGDGKQVRDVLFVADLVAAFEAAEAHLETLAGQVFNIGGGPENALSLIEFTDRLTQLTGMPLDLEFADWRAGDQPWYVSDTRRFSRATGWRPRVHPNDGLLRLNAWLEQLQPQLAFPEAVP